jgi:hypothetical protein
VSAGRGTLPADSAGAGNLKRERFFRKATAKVYEDQLADPLPDFEGYRIPKSVG